jgi:hypothetical protein
MEDNSPAWHSPSTVGFSILDEATLTLSGYFNTLNYLDFTGVNFMEEPSGLHNFLEIVTKPDNPIVAMLILVIFFTWLGREAFKNAS